MRGTTGRPSDGSVYSVTSRGEVLLFDPEAARNIGEEENSVVGEQLNPEISLVRYRYSLKFLESLQ